MTDVNPLALSGGIGPEQTTRHAAEHSGAYAHRPAPHLEPAPVIPPDHFEHLAAVADAEDSAEAE